MMMMMMTTTMMRRREEKEDGDVDVEHLFNVKLYIGILEPVVGLINTSIMSQLVCVVQSVII